MSRRRYVVAYDIREPKRLREVHATMKRFGYPLQYSVFVCDLDAMEKIAMRQAVEQVMHLKADSLAVIDLGDAATRGWNALSSSVSLPLSREAEPGLSEVALILRARE